MINAMSMPLASSASDRRRSPRPSIALLAVFSVLLGCDPVADPGPVATGPKGIYVLNEGAYLASNAELSFIGEDRSSASGAVFSTINPDKVLGDIAQHATLAFDKLYVVLNNSRKIEVVEPGTHRWLRTISLSRSPRAIEVLSPAKAYISNMDSTVSVLDLVSGVVTKDIVVGAYPEGLHRSGDRLYVFNSAWGYGSTVSVIDLTADTVRGTFETPSGPTYGVAGSNGVLHVLCTGYPGSGGGAELPGALLTINAASGQVLDTLWMTQQGGRLAVDASGTLYVTGSGGAGPAVWKISGGASPAVVTSNLVAGSYYGIGVDVSRSELYLATSGDFAGNGTVQVHTLSGAPIRTYTSGIGVAPNSFVMVP